MILAVVTGVRREGLWDETVVDYVSVESDFDSIKARETYEVYELNRDRTRDPYIPFAKWLLKTGQAKRVPQGDLIIDTEDVANQF